MNPLPHTSDSDMMTEVACPSEGPFVSDTCAAESPPVGDGPPEVMTWSLQDRPGDGEGVVVSKTSAGVVDFSLTLMEHPTPSSAPTVYGTFDFDL